MALPGPIAWGNPYPSNPPRNPNPRMVIIGVELRLKTPDGQQEEIAMLGCHLDIPASVNAAYPFYLNGTIHTSLGDVNFGNAERLQLPLGESYMKPERRI